MVADVESDLFEAPDGDEGGDRVGHRPKVAHRQAGSNAHHVCFGNAAVVEAIREALLERVENSISDIAREEDNALVESGQIFDFTGEGVSHATPSFFQAAATSSAVGIR